MIATPLTFRMETQHYMMPAERDSCPFSTLSLLSSVTWISPIRYMPYCLHPSLVLKASYLSYLCGSTFCIHADSLPQNGATPLHLASKYGHVELVRQLCVAGCDVNAVTEHGFTADEVAANSSHDQLATLIHTLRQVLQQYPPPPHTHTCTYIYTLFYEMFTHKKLYAAS